MPVSAAETHLAWSHDGQWFAMFLAGRVFHVDVATWTVTPIADRPIGLCAILVTQSGDIVLGDRAGFLERLKPPAPTPPA